MARREDWAQSLYREIEKAREAPFSLASHNCALWCSDVVLAMTGIDHAKPYRSKIKTAASVARILKKTPLDQIATLAMGEPIAPLMAQRGDVVLVDNGDPLLGICVGESVACVSKDGLTLIPITSAIKAWRV